MRDSIRRYKFIHRDNYNMFIIKANLSYKIFPNDFIQKVNSLSKIDPIPKMNKVWPDFQVEALSKLNIS